jgi:hypothetical protein
VCCVNACNVGIVVYLFLFGDRTLWNATKYYGINELHKFIVRCHGDNGRPTAGRMSKHEILFFVSPQKCNEKNWFAEMESRRIAPNKVSFD